jgi:hypothetical protein
MAEPEVSALVCDNGSGMVKVGLPQHVGLMMSAASPKPEVQAFFAYILTSFCTFIFSQACVVV